MVFVQFEMPDSFWPENRINIQEVLEVFFGCVWVLGCVWILGSSGNIKEN